MLEVRGVTKHFGSLVAVDGVSLNVEQGRAARHHRPERRRQDDVLQHDHGLLPAHRGRDRVRRRDHHRGCRSQQRVALGMARTFQITEIFPELTVRENVRIAVESRRTATVCAPGSAAPRRARVTREVDEVLAHGRPDRPGRPAGGRAVARRSARGRDRHGAGAASRACCCWTSRPPAWASRRPIRSPA